MTHPSVKQFVTFCPVGDLELRLLSNGREYDATITMRNTFNGQVAYKFRADNYKDITVTPSKGILDENQEKTVGVVYSTRDVKAKPPEKLQVLVTPVDEQCSLDHKVPDLFTRADRKDIQEYIYPIRIPSLNDTINETEDFEERKQPRPLKDRRNVTAPLPMYIGRPAPISAPRAMSAPEYVQSMSASSLDETGGEAYLDESLNDSVFLHPGEEDGRELPYTWKTQAGMRFPQGGLPHYELHLSSRDSKWDKSKLPLGKRLMGSFSQIGVMMKDLKENSRSVRDNQRLCFSIFWIFLVLLCVLVSFFLVLPKYNKYRRRHRHDHTGDMNLAQAAVEEVAETYIENRKGPTLDELIHARMS